jgi:hypothetical protein
MSYLSPPSATPLFPQRATASGPRPAALKQRKAQVLLDGVNGDIERCCDLSLRHAFLHAEQNYRCSKRGKSAENCASFARCFEGSLYGHLLSDGTVGSCRIEYQRTLFLSPLDLANDVRSDPKQIRLRKPQLIETPMLYEPHENFLRRIPRKLGVA